MITEEIKVNERKTLILHINPATDKVYQIEVNTPNSLKEKFTHFIPNGISREEALQKYFK